MRTLFLTEGPVLTDEQFMKSSLEHYARQQKQKEYYTDVALILVVAIPLGLLALAKIWNTRRLIGDVLGGGTIYLLGRLYRAHRITKASVDKVGAKIKEASEK